MGLAFADRYMPLEGGWVEEIYRVAGGDNRPLPTRGIAADAVASELAPGRDRARAAPPAGDAAVERLTVREAAARIRAVERRVSIVVFYQTFTNWQETFGELARVAAFCREAGVELLAFNTDKHETLVAELPGRLAAANATSVPLLYIHPWKSGMLDATMRELGLHVGMQWLPPLAAVRDASGRVTWQAQGVTDWSAVIAAARAAAR